MKTQYVVNDIPSDKKSLNKVLKFLGDDTWSEHDKSTWIGSGANNIFYDNTVKSYNYTNYEQDGESSFFSERGLELINYTSI
jgi:hypothetical protein